MKSTRLVVALAAAGLALPAHAQTVPDFHCPAGSQIAHLGSETSPAPKGMVIVARQAQYAKGMPVRVCVAPKGSPLAGSNNTPLIVLGSIAAVGAVAVVVAGGSTDNVPISR